MWSNGSANGQPTTLLIWSRNSSDAQRRKKRRQSNSWLRWAETEAKSLRRLLEDQRAKISKADAEPDDRQLSFLPDVAAEAEQRRRDRRHWKAKLQKLSSEIEEEPQRVRRSYSVAADRLETIGLLYLWPEN
jgi:dipeptidyl aminopeptidase/acylaminoacyl peptidase